MTMLCRRIRSNHVSQEHCWRKNAKQLRRLAKRREQRAWKQENV